MAKTNRLTAVLAESRRQLPTLLLLSALSNILLLVSSVYMMQVFDRVLSSGSVNTLIWLSVIAIFAIGIYGMLENARRIILRRTGAWIESELAPDVIKEAVEARLTHGRAAAGLGDVADIRGFVAGDALLVLLDVPWMPIFLAVIWLMHPILGMIAIGGGVVLFAIAVVNDMHTRRALAEAKHAKRNATDDAGQFIENAETLSGLGMIAAVIKRWRGQTDDSEAASGHAAEAAIGYFNIARTVRLALQIAILGAAAWLVVHDELTSGGMIAASIILSRALSPVERAIGAWRSYGAFAAARRRIRQLYAQARKITERIALPRPAGKLDVKGVGFLSPENRETILRAVAFDLAPGEMCGVLGPSGSGKTTLCKLLVGAWRPSYGTIRLDGADVAEWDSEDLGQYVGYLPQNIELFRGTIAENIARMGEVDEARVLEAAQMAGAHEMILSLPNGYETDVGAYADRLSGGQRQRVGLARALYGNPSLIVLDEPNSNLDGTGEIALQNALRKLKEGGHTVVIVSHLPNILRLVDKILVVNEGTTTKFGPRDQILTEMMQAGRAASGRKGKSAQVAE